jgi:hypothetical protein
MRALVSPAVVGAGVIALMVSVSPVSAVMMTTAVRALPAIPKATPAVRLVTSVAVLAANARLMQNVRR